MSILLQVQLCGPVVRAVDSITKGCRFETRQITSGRESGVKHVLAD